MRRTATKLLAVVALACLPSVAPALASGRTTAPGASAYRLGVTTGSEVGPILPLSNAGRWITDATGRVVILHGLNMVNKITPYQPGAIGFGADDADFLKRNGFNTVRLGLIYKAVEPTPGHFDGAYIKRVRSIERVLAKRGIVSLLDFHQDLYNERFGGEGWPDWATLDDGLPAEPLAGFPATYVTSPGLNRSFDNFWANDQGPGGVGLQTRMAAAWARVAKIFKGDAGVLGYDILNEPWPGTGFGDCLNTAGCAAFDTGKLAPFYRRVIRKIRAVEMQHIVFYEPHVLFNFGSQTHLPDLSGSGFKHLGFSFHNYCTPGLVAGSPATCPEAEDAVFGNADARAKGSGDALMLSEFGATDDVSVLNRVTAEADRHMVSWQEWHYCGCDDPTTSGPGDTQALVKNPKLPPRGANVFHNKLKALARPYPQTIAGTPLRWSFNPSSGRFVLAYTPKRADGHGSFRGGTSGVFLPAVQYPNGFTAHVSGGSISKAAHSHRIYITANAGAHRIKLVVTQK